MKRPIMIMAGGTGGHVYPGLAVADYLRSQGVPLLWLGTEKGLEANVVPEAGYPLQTLVIGGVRGKGLKTLIIAPFRILYAVVQSLKIMLKYRPAAVLGMGGFASGPGAIAAWLMRIPILIHEQNAIAGMTNGWLSRIATKVLEAFPDTFPQKKGVECVGNPVRDSIINLKKQIKPDHAKRILIVGGSLGAVKLNRVVPAVLSQLSLERSLLIWHQTGQRDYEETIKRYQELELQARIAPFLDHIEQAYGWADLVICRAGALTVSELAVAALPAVLVPYPHAVDDHQTANARYLVDAGAAVMVADQDLTEEKLLRVMRDLLTTPAKLMSMSANARKVARVDATRKVAEMVMEVAYG